MNLNQITLPALDIAASTTFYRQLRFEQIVESPHYARFKASTGDASFSVYKDVVNANNGVVFDFECERLDEQVAELASRGIACIQPSRDERWLWREAPLLDHAGNVICLYRGGMNRLDPLWKVMQ